jgi:hypothetical protein
MAGRGVPVNDNLPVCIQKKDLEGLPAGTDYATVNEGWRRRAGSNRCIAVLQTAPLTTWVRRPARIIAGLVPISQLARWLKGMTTSRMLC